MESKQPIDLSNIKQETSVPEKFAATIKAILELTQALEFDQANSEAKPLSKQSQEIHQYFNKRVHKGVIAGKGELYFYEYFPVPPSEPILNIDKATLQKICNEAGFTKGRLPIFLEKAYTGSKQNNTLDNEQKSILNNYIKISNQALRRAKQCGVIGTTLDHVEQLLEDPKTISSKGIFQSALNVGSQNDIASQLALAKSMGSKKNQAKAVFTVAGKIIGEHAASWVPHVGPIISDLLDFGAGEAFDKLLSDENKRYEDSMLDNIINLADDRSIQKISSSSTKIFERISRQNNLLKNLFENFQLLDKKMTVAGLLLGGKTSGLNFKSPEQIENFLANIYNMGDLHDSVLHQIRVVLSICFSMITRLSERDYSRRLYAWIGEALPMMITTLTDADQYAWKSINRFNRFSRAKHEYVISNLPELTHADTLSIKSIGKHSFGNAFGIFFEMIR